MRSSKTGAVSTLFVVFFLVAGNVHATPTERLEGKYLKSRIKLRIDEDWKVQSGNVSGRRQPISMTRPGPRRTFPTT